MALSEMHTMINEGLNCENQTFDREAPVLGELLQNNQARREYANRVRLQALERQIDIIQDHLRAVNHALEAISMLLNADRVANIPLEPLMLMDDAEPHWAVSWVSAFEYDQGQNLAEPWSPTVLEESISENEALYDITNVL